MSGYYGAPKRSAPAPLSLGVTNTSSTMMSSGNFAKRHRSESTTLFIRDGSTHDDATAADWSPKGHVCRYIPTREAMDWASPRTT
jgi:hypothetical protein